MVSESGTLGRRAERCSVSLSKSFRCCENPVLAIGDGIPLLLVDASCIGRGRLVVSTLLLALPCVALGSMPRFVRRESGILASTVSGLNWLVVSLEIWSLPLPTAAVYGLRCRSIGRSREGE